MIQPGFDNESIHQRKDQIMLQWLWEAIVYGVSLQTQPRT
jgi:hypothetical protein